MRQVSQQTNFKEGLISLYYLMIHADGKVSDKEIKMGELMCRHEMIDYEELSKILEEKKKENKDAIYNKCINILKKCDPDISLKCIAWMSLIANSDGFMSSEEWGLLYKIYSNELFLDLRDILKVQKSLPRN